MRALHRDCLALLAALGENPLLAMMAQAQTGQALGGAGSSGSGNAAAGTGMPP
jgi:hypothetical protein